MTVSEHLPMHPSHTSRTATSLKTKIIRSRKRGHTREHDNCLDEQIKKQSSSACRRLSKSRSIAMLSLIETLSGSSSRRSCRSRSLATRNSLKSWMGQNVNSPFSNIRAVTFKSVSPVRPGQPLQIVRPPTHARDQNPIELAALPPAAISCLGAFRTPAACVRGRARDCRRAKTCTAAAHSSRGQSHSARVVSALRPAAQ